MGSRLIDEVSLVPKRAAAVQADKERREEMNRPVSRARHTDKPPVHREAVRAFAKYETRQSRGVQKKKKETSSNKRIPEERTYTVIRYEEGDEYTVSKTSTLKFPCPASVKVGRRVCLQFEVKKENRWFYGRVVGFRSTEKEATDLMEENNAKMKKTPLSKSIPDDRAFTVIRYDVNDEYSVQKTNTLKFPCPGAVKVGRRVCLQFAVKGQMTWFYGQVVGFRSTEQKATDLMEKDNAKWKAQKKEENMKKASEAKKAEKGKKKREKNVPVQTGVAAEEEDEEEQDGEDQMDIEGDDDEVAENERAGPPLDHAAQDAVEDVLEHVVAASLQDKSKIEPVDETDEYDEEEEIVTIEEEEDDEVDDNDDEEEEEKEEEEDKHEEEEVNEVKEKEQNNEEMN